MLPFYKPVGALPLGVLRMQVVGASEQIAAADNSMYVAFKAIDKFYVWCECRLLLNFDAGFGWMNAIVEFYFEDSNAVSMDGLDGGGRLLLGMIKLLLPAT